MPPYVAGPFNDMSLYLQWGGKLPGTETWSCGLRLIKKGAGPWTSLDQVGMIPAITTAVQAFHTRATSLIGSAAKLSFVKLNAIGEDGLYIQDLTTQQIVADVAGASAMAPHPNQVALAITLETGFSRGPAHRGRFYMPLPTMSVGTDGLVPTSERDNVKASAETLRVALNAVNANWQVGVMSRKLGSPGARAVTSISVGRALDTQRRRRRRLLENY